MSMREEIKEAHDVLDELKISKGSLPERMRNLQNRIGVLEVDLKTLGREAFYQQSAAISASLKADQRFWQGRAIGLRHR